MNPPNAASLHHGDRVVIVADWHPWKGHAGTLIENPKSAKFPFTVALDEGDAMRAAVYENEVERV